MNIWELSQRQIWQEVHSGDVSEYVKSAKFLLEHKWAGILPSADDDLHAAKTDAYVVGGLVKILVAGTNFFSCEPSNMYINSVCFIVTEGMNGMCLTHEVAVSLIYSLMQEGSTCLKCTLVSTDMGVKVMLTLEALNHIDCYVENCHLFKRNLPLVSIVGKYMCIRILYVRVKNAMDVGVRCFEKYSDFSGFITNYQFGGTIIERDLGVVSFLDIAMACMTKVNTVGLEVKFTFNLHERVNEIKSNEEAIISTGRQTTSLSVYWKTYYCDLKLVKNT
ncbi:hypothetical protein A2U01_0020061, partial [Trifolium medium]|nr:hypothetical protein [Trifolium medium]